MGLEANLNLKFDFNTGSMQPQEVVEDFVKTAVCSVGSLLAAGAVTEQSNSLADAAKIVAEQATAITNLNSQMGVCTGVVQELIKYAQTGQLNLTQMQNFIENTIIQTITIKNDEAQQLKETTQAILDRNNEIMAEIETLNVGSSLEGIEWVEESFGDESSQEVGENGEGKTNSKSKSKKLTVDENNPNAARIQELLDEYNGNLSILVETIQPKQVQIQADVSQAVADGQNKQMEASNFANTMASTLKSQAQEKFQQISNALINTMTGNKLAMGTHQVNSSAYANADRAAAAKEAAKATGGFLGGLVTFGVSAIAGGVSAGEGALFAAAAGTRDGSAGVAKENAVASQKLGETLGNQFASILQNQANQLILGSVSTITQAILGKDIASFVSPEITKMIENNQQELS